MEQLAQAIATIAGVFAFAALLALIVERLVEKFVKPPLQKYEWDAATAYVALALGVAFSWSFGIDLLTPLAAAVELSPFVPWAGYLLTGLVVGGGSNLLHDLWPGSSGTLIAANTLVVSDSPTASAAPVQEASA